MQGFVYFGEHFSRQIVLKIAVCDLSIFNQPRHLLTCLLNDINPRIQQPDFLLKFCKVVFLVLYLGFNLATFYLKRLDHERTLIESSRYFFFQLNHALIVLSTRFINKTLISFELLADFVDFEHEHFLLHAHFVESVLDLLDSDSLLIAVFYSSLYISRHSFLQNGDF